MAITMLNHRVFLVMTTDLYVQGSATEGETGS